MRRLVFLLLFVPVVAGAERFSDGLYLSGGVFLSELRVDFLGLEVDVDDNRPMVFVGYGKTSKPLGRTSVRVFAGVEGFWLDASKRKRGSETTMRPDVIRETEVVERVTEGDVTTETTTTKRDIQERPVDTRSYSVRQGGTWGVGVRLGLSDQTDKRAGSLYLLGGYADSSLEASGIVRNNDGGVEMEIVEQDVDFSGWYYGLGYEYLFGEHLGLRVDYMKIKYSDERFSVEGGGRERAGMGQQGVFAGVSLRF